MKSCKSFFKLYHLRPFITGTSNTFFTSLNATRHVIRESG